MLSFFKNLSLKNKFMVLGTVFLMIFSTYIVGMIEIAKTTYFQKLERDHIELTMILSFHADQYVRLLKTDPPSRSEADLILNRRSDNKKQKGIRQLMEEMNLLRMAVLEETNVLEKEVFKFFGFGRAFELVGEVGPDLDRTIYTSLDQLEQKVLTFDDFEKKFVGAVTGYSGGGAEFAPLVYDAGIFVGNLVGMISLFFLLFAAALLLFIVIPLNKSLRHLTEVSKIIADGDLEKEIIVDQKDEIGQLSDAFRNMRDKIRETVQMAHKIAQGDLTVQVNILSDKDMLGKSLTQMIKNLTHFAIDVQESAEQVATGAEQLNRGAEQISQGTSEQSAGVEQTSSSMEQMSSIINQNAENARETAIIAEKAARDAIEGRRSVEETIQAMKTISQNIMIVDEIAGQTNMLALNASIEAARAGKQGKGFAVVATEIGNLAKKTRSAAQDINTLSVNNLDIAERTGELLKEMVPGIQKTAELVQNISAAGTEQAGGIGEVNNAMCQLEQTIQENAASTEEMATSSREFSSQAERLLEVSSFFQISDALRKQLQKDSEQALMIGHKVFIDLEAMPESHRKMFMKYMRPVANGEKEEDRVREEKKAGLSGKKSGVSINVRDDLDESDFESYM